MSIPHIDGIMTLKAHETYQPKTYGHGQPTTHIHNNSYTYKLPTMNAADRSKPARLPKGTEESHLGI